jgi:hypothetical protein
MLALSGASLVAHADQDDVFDSDNARMAKKLANKIEPIVNVPVQYNFFQRTGLGHTQDQNQLVLQPLIPATISHDWNLLLRPLVWGSFEKHPVAVANQTSPFQLEAFISPKKSSDFAWGLGPFFQAPGSGISSGSNQYGAGVTGAFFYKPEHWVIGGTAYNSWAIGGPTNNGTVNVLYVVPSISYVTDAAYTFTASMQPSFNYNARNTSNPLLLLAAKTTKVFDVPVQFQAGPTYMLSSTPTSGQGIGFRIQITAAAKE